MTLTLSPDELRRLPVAQRTLLSPLDHPDVNAWRAAVSHELKELLGADTGTFFMRTDDADPGVSTDFPKDRLDAYPDFARPLYERYGLWERAVELGVYSRRMFYAPHEAEIYRSTYYNEFIVPIRAFHSIGMTVDQDVDLRPTVYLHQDSPTGPGFGERGLDLLRLLFPAFAAGVRTFNAVQEHRRTLLATVDRVGAGLWIHGSDGELLHRNAAAGRAVEADPEGEVLQKEACRLAGEVARIAARSTGRISSVRPHDLRVCGTRSDGAPAALSRLVKTAGARYRLQGGISRAHDPKVAVLVSLERLTPELPSDERLRKRFGFTRQEARVARLLAGGSSNGEVAGTLHISPHTARHHTERVFRKMGVRSRSRVLPTIQEAGDE